MRTTLTLDDDVAVQIETLCRERKTTLKGTINTALRQGLRAMAETRPSRREVHTKAVSLGRCLLPTIDDVSEALAIEHGLTMCSTDSDFARFPGLRRENPIG